MGITDETAIKIVDLRTNANVTPFGICENVVFSYRLESSRQGARQLAYRIYVAQDESFKQLAWDSKWNESDECVEIFYKGEYLKPETRYFWKVAVRDELHQESTSEVSWFETGLKVATLQASKREQKHFLKERIQDSTKDSTKEVWCGAQWIGSSMPQTNADALDTYEIIADFKIEKGEKVGFVIGGRNKDNYVLIELNIKKMQVFIDEYSDEAWFGSRKEGYEPIVKRLSQKAKGYLADEGRVSNHTDEREEGRKSANTDENSEDKISPNTYRADEDKISPNTYRTNEDKTSPNTYRVDEDRKSTDSYRKDGYTIPAQVYQVAEMNSLKISVDHRKLSLALNGVSIISQEEILPENPINQPRKTYLMSIGLKQEKGKVVYSRITLKNTETSEVYQDETFEDESSILSRLGKIVNERLVVENRFDMVCPIPALHLRKGFNVSKRVKSARLYAAARGFYNVYLDGHKVGDEFFAPGFTDYRLRIPYQTYDITDLLRSESYVSLDRMALTTEHTLCAIVGKGYYSGYCGYSGPMIYGKENSFIAKMVISYEDGSKEVIVTDGSWQYTQCGPVVDSDYLDGENYDARLEEVFFEPEEQASGCEQLREGHQLASQEEQASQVRQRKQCDQNAKDHYITHAKWQPCGIKSWPGKVIPTNGKFTKEVPFQLTPQVGSGATVQSVLKPIGRVENPKGHFVYDFGQNLVGVIRLKVKGERGLSIKLRYGEMSYKNGEIYIKNIRTAANTDIYTLKGAAEGETYTTQFAAHGFRYVEITGNGFEMTDMQLVIEMEALVLCNAHEVTGHFECSNPLINQLQSNIMWGQKGNYLLVPTDCPQRNERMGWTGDAGAFAGTAAFNMDVESFTKKWLTDVIDAQLMYNKEGAVPDTAPLGGDNRPAGCSGWGDAAVIVPWEMYKAYGKISILEQCYDMMTKWISYQSLEERQGRGIRIVDGEERWACSDLASKPFIQLERRRGDHLTFDESTPFMLTATAYAAYSADLMSRIAHILGREEDANKYKERFNEVRKAFNEAWVKEDGTLAYWGEMSIAREDVKGNIINQTYYSNEAGSLNHPSQTAYAVAIDFNLIPEEKLEGTRKGFLQAIEDRNYHLSVGFLGIAHLSTALSKVGLDDAAFRLLEQEESPGWLYSVKNGATTIWERWNSYIAETDTFGEISMNSFNHYAYGAIGEWMYQNILGIRTGERVKEKGYKQIILRPKIGDFLTYAKGFHKSPYGKIESSWRIENSKFLYQCKIPPNTQATLYMPQKNGEEKVYHLVSGNYDFESSL